MATPVTGIRIPADLLALIDARAIEGKTRTDIVIELIRSGLGVTPSGEDLGHPDRYTALNSRLTELEATVKHLLDNRETPVRQMLDECETDVEQVLDNRLTGLLDERTTPVKQPSENAPQNLPSASAVQQSVKQSVKQRPTVTGKVAPQNYGVMPPAADDGLSQTALCNFYGLSWRNLKRNSAIAGFDTVESYLQQMTGFTWAQDKTSGATKLYFPGS